VSVPTAELGAAPAVTRARPRLPSLAEAVRGGRLYLVLGAAALAIAALTLLIPSTPSYDPWAWLVWGREIAHLDLQTTGGPTWKPLPVLFTTIFSLFGGASPDLWLVVARAGALMAVAMTFKVAWRITRDLVAVGARGSATVDTSGSTVAGGAVRAPAKNALPDEANFVARLQHAEVRQQSSTTHERWITLAPVLFAATVAAASLINSKGFVTDNALGYSEGLMTALVLIALDRHLDGARRQAFVVGFFAALDRPELWALWGPYGVYLWWKDAGARRLVAALFVLIPVLWFGPELWGSGHLFRGVTRAQHVRSNSAALASCPFCTELRHHAWPRVMLRIKLVSLLAMGAAAFGLWRTRGSWSASTRGRLLLLVVGAVGWLWWIGVAVLTQAGFSGNDRYLVLGSALISIAGGVGWGWGAAGAANVAWRWLGGARARTAGTTAAAVAIAAAILIATPPWIGPSIIDVPATHRALVYQAHLRTDMTRALQAAGGRNRVLACGTVMTEGFQVPMLAWNLYVHTLRIEASPTVAGAGAPPNVVFQTRAQRSAHLLPIVGAWHGVGYTRVAHARTFRVFAHCANGAPL
jgi:hypothetical protein